LPLSGTYIINPTLTQSSQFDSDTHTIYGKMSGQTICSRQNTAYFVWFSLQKLWGSRMILHLRSMAKWVDRLRVRQNIAYFVWF